MKKNVIALIISLLILLSWSRDSVAALKDLIPGLYGGDGITLTTISTHTAHFTTQSLVNLNNLSTQIGSEIGAFPFSSSVGAFSYAFDKQTGSFVKSSRSLGPIFAERAETLGRGKFNFGVSLSSFTLHRFEGQDLDNITVVAPHIPDSQLLPTVREGFENDDILINVDTDIDIRKFSFTTTYGITDQLDFGFVIPFIEIDMNVRALAQIVVSPINPTPTVHSFVGAPDQPFDTASAHASGLGDIVLRSKYQILKSDVINAAAMIQAKLATGDEDNFLGTGDTNIKPILVLSRTFFEIITPHINVGYDVNIDNSNQSALEYALGFDVGNKIFTVAGDVLGSHELDGDNIGDNIISGLLGFKWNPFEQFILTSNIQIPLNPNSGLRSNLIATIGMEFSL